MIPALVVSAHEEWIFVPTKYRLSNTFAGSVYQVSRAGGGGGATSGPGAVCGATHTRTSVPVKSNPAAALARARNPSIGLALCASAAAAPSPTHKPRAAPGTRFMISSRENFRCGIVSGGADEVKASARCRNGGCGWRTGAADCARGLSAESPRIPGGAHAVTSQPSQRRDRRGRHDRRAGHANRRGTDEHTGAQAHDRRRAGPPVESGKRRLEVGPGPQAAAARA